MPRAAAARRSRVNARHAAGPMSARGASARTPRSPAARGPASCRRARPTPSEAVVFVHGNPGSADDWERLVGAAGATGAARRSPSTCRTSARRSRRTASSTRRSATRSFLGEALGELGVERVAPRPARLRRPDRAGLGGDAPRRPREHRPDRHRHPARLQLAQPGADLAHAGARRAVPGDRHRRALPLRCSTATSRAGCRASSSTTMYDHYDRRTRRAVLKLYRATDDPGGVSEDLIGAAGAARHPGAGDLGRARRLPAGRLRRAPARRVPLGRRPRAAGQRPLAVRRRAGDGRAAAGRVPRGSRAARRRSALRSGPWPWRPRPRGPSAAPW